MCFVVELNIYAEVCQICFIYILLVHVRNLLCQGKVTRQEK